MGIRGKIKFALSLLGILIAHILVPFSLAAIARSAQTPQHLQIMMEKMHHPVFIFFIPFSAACLCYYLVLSRMLWQANGPDKKSRILLSIAAALFSGYWELFLLIYTYKH
ncbi:MAG TPA: hypothetical protein VHN12_12890 [Geobacteraceae bacterium]|nr:hypothetical protein [Geobacteraceae bacterium]